MTQDALSSLRALGNQLRLQLLESAEFRALTVVDRTISELSEIMSASAPAEAGEAAPPASPAPIEAPPAAALASTSPPPASVVQTPLAPPPAAPAPAPAPIVQKRIEPIVPSPTSSQMRMAKAIAETIAAKAYPLNAASRLDQALSAAS
jgi:hypothetical protein